MTTHHHGQLMPIIGNDFELSGEGWREYMLAREAGRLSGDKNT